MVVARHTRAYIEDTPCAEWPPCQHEFEPACRDNYRAFFEQIFPLLLRRIFGYDGSSWLTQIAHGEREADAHALVELLSPSGALPYFPILNPHVLLSSVVQLCVTAVCFILL